MKKNIKKFLTLALSSILLLSACSSTNNTQNSSTDSTQSSNKSATLRKYKLGLNGTDHRAWENVRKRLNNEGIDLEFVEFSDYVQPNKALSSGDIDLNAFQTEIYFENFIKENNIDNLTSIGYTVVAPMGIYSKKVTDLKDLPTDRALKIAIPNDTSNGGRALKFLESLGYIKLDPSKGNLPTLLDIKENTKNLEITEMAANQIPASLPDLDFAVINNGVAYEAGLTIAKDALAYEDYKEERMKDYWNIIAVKKDDAQKDDFKKIVEIYQTDETKKALDEQYGGQSIPVW